MATAPDNEPGNTRRTVLYTGRVQGVGFRFTTEAIASRFAVTGAVRNLHDGTVELVAEGTAAELDRFQEAVQQAMQHNISTAEADDSRATGEFTSFGIAF